MKTSKNSVSAWHTLSVESSFETVNTSATGLKQQEAEERLKRYGNNSLPKAKKRSAFIRFLSHFHNILIYVLLGSAVVTAALAHWIDTGVILAVVMANAIISFIQEGKAESAMGAIQQMLAPIAHVIRDAERVSIDGEELVPGDIVLIEAGDKVPADLRLFDAHGLSIQESILTGESVAVVKLTSPVDEQAALGDRTCMAFSGTLVSSGQGKGIVIATGGNTEIGRISSLLSEVETLTTPLIRQMNVFAKWLTLVILVLASILLVFGYFSAQHDFTEMFMSVVGLSVAAIPEGLPAGLTSTLVIGVQAMARRQAIVRRLPAIETLGSVSVICSDKAGTLTRNEMMVASVLTQQHLFTIEGEGYRPKGALKLNEQQISPSEHSVLEEIARAAILCNDASLIEREGVWRTEGDPMEGALLSFSAKMNVEARTELASWKRTDAIPFDARHRYMATLSHDHQHHACIFVKGAPERILEMCDSQRNASGQNEALDREHWQQKMLTMAAKGQRLLAFAMKPVDANYTVLEQDDLHHSLILLGIVGLIDPPRSEAIKAVAECHEAGIRVKMITGDHAQTAAAIAKQIGLKNSQNVLTGKELDGLDEQQLKAQVLECDIFARTSPEHKLRLVTAIQAHGLTVAMTGDGVNDAPALKRADAGIAMGLKGSEAAKEAAELVLADDNFATIVSAVREGRTVYDNLKKIISWTLPTNAGEAMTIIVALLFGMTLPITPVQILWVNLITAVTLGIALAFEPTEENTMRRPPRSRNESLLSVELMWHIVLVSMLFLSGVYGIYHYAINQGYSVELARTLAVNTLVVMEIFHLFFIRNIHGTSLTWKAICGTKVILRVVFVISCAQFAITYLQWLQAIFGTESIAFWDGILVVGIGVMLFVVIEVEKQLRLLVGRVRA